jgi:hypothetical protein
MAKFMLLLYDTTENREAFARLGPEEMQRAVEKYMVWSKKPFTVNSERLGEDSGRVIRVRGGKSRVADGPFSESKEVLGGYYTIEAADYDEAVKRSLDHPHLEHGGSIEIRQVYGT